MSKAISWSYVTTADTLESQGMGTSVFRTVLSPRMPNLSTISAPQLQVLTNPAQTSPAVLRSPRQPLEARLPVFEQRRVVCSAILGGRHWHDDHDSIAIGSATDETNSELDRSDEEHYRKQSSNRRSSQDDAVLSYVQTFHGECVKFPVSIVAAQTRSARIIARQTNWKALVDRSESVHHGWNELLHRL